MTKRTRKQIQAAEIKQVISAGLLGLFSKIEQEGLKSEELRKEP